jgi:hypothetical protein
MQAQWIGKRECFSDLQETNHIHLTSVARIGNNFTYAGFEIKIQLRNQINIQDAKVSPGPFSERSINVRNNAAYLPIATTLTPIHYWKSDIRKYSSN